MPVTKTALAALLAAMFGGAAGCAPPTVQGCQRYDAVSLTRENGFSARVDWKNAGLVDLPTEHVEVALTAIRPMKGPIELVHLVGDTEADHWVLNVPDFNNSPTSVCSIAAPGVAANCGASLQHLPLSPGGYYFLRAGDNTVLEAGLAFYLCN